MTVSTNLQITMPNYDKDKFPLHNKNCWQNCFLLKVSLSSHLLSPRATLNNFTTIFLLRVGIWFQAD